MRLSFDKKRWVCEGAAAAVLDACPFDVGEVGDDLLLVNGRPSIDVEMLPLTRSNSSEGKTFAIGGSSPVLFSAFHWFCRSRARILSIPMDVFDIPFAGLIMSGPDAFVPDRGRRRACPFVPWIVARRRARTTVPPIAPNLPTRASTPGSSVASSSFFSSTSSPSSDPGGMTSSRAACKRSVVRRSMRERWRGSTLDIWRMKIPEHITRNPRAIVRICSAEAFRP